MAKKPNAAASNVVDMLDGIKSKKDFGYQHAKHRDEDGSFRSWAMKNIAGYPDNISEEDKAEVYSGYQLRFNANVPAVQYVVEGETLLPVVKGMDLSKREVITVGIDYAMSVSGYEFGQMRSKKPALHKIVGDYRTKFSKYASGAWKALTKKDAGERARGVNNGFLKHMETVKNASITRNKTALAKGDPTAVGAEILNQAWIAFFKVINNK